MQRLLRLSTLLILAASTLLITWLILTPDGLLGKMDAIGYSVCHLAPQRSYAIGPRPFPLCARCSGMFLGALVGMVYLFRLGRYGGLPPLRSAIVFFFFALAWAVDGANSFARLLPGLPTLYPSQNWLRLITGTGMGLGLAAILVPIVHQVLWDRYLPQSALTGWRPMVGLVATGAVGALGIASQNLLLLYPLAILSGLGVLALLTCVYAVLWVLLTKRENRYRGLQEAWVPLLAGFSTALIQIALVDAARYWLTGSWTGFSLPG
jgi:uncharacterized membrane protein